MYRTNSAKKDTTTGQGQTCFYTNTANGNNALCTRGNGHDWRTPSQWNPGFMCARNSDELWQPQTRMLNTKGGLVFQII